MEILNWLEFSGNVSDTWDRVEMKSRWIETKYVEVTLRPNGSSEENEFDRKMVQALYISNTTNRKKRRRTIAKRQTCQNCQVTYAPKLVYV